MLPQVALGGNAEAPSKTIPEKTVEEKIPSSILQSERDNILTLGVENDLFGRGTDNYYTSGIRASYLDVSSSIPEFAHDIDDIIPGFEINETTSLFYSIGQNIFSPKDITNIANQVGDRPWAGYLYGSLGMTSITDNHQDQIEVTLGVVGPYALGKQVQKFVHRHISNSPDPKGWDDQLNTEPALTVGWQRTFPQYLGAQIGPLYASASPYVGITAGNIYTFANTGFSVRMGPDTEKWQDLPDRVRPAMPGSGFYEIPAAGWSWYLFAGAEARLVGRNIFLDGNTFSDSASVDKNYLVGDANAGLAITLGQMRISYTANYRTREFKGQDKPEIFGAIGIGYRF
ncbi:MAG: DUF2219 family protein [Alphaproteobacteria bacterium]|nr:DUF2219 family protein [Alphaproteobacteria bacterium]